MREEHGCTAGVFGAWVWGGEMVVDGEGVEGDGEECGQVGAGDEGRGEGGYGGVGATDGAIWTGEDATWSTWSAESAAKYGLGVELMLGC